MKYILALDQGTTSSRAVLFDGDGKPVASHGIEFPQLYPKPGWVEHRPDDILASQIEAARKAVEKSGVRLKDIEAVGITSQRETTLLWERETQKPLHNAIVWQCRRTAPLIERLKRDGLGNVVRDRTGLIPDAYFSGTKLQWLLDTVPEARARAEKGELCFGTVDSFLASSLCAGHPHVTDATNAARTMLYNIYEHRWDDVLLRAMDIPEPVLPRVVDTSGVVGMLDKRVLGREIPVAALVGDQQSALFGNGCFAPGMSKNTYGTGCFLLMNTGEKLYRSQNGLLATIAIGLGGKVQYALEGSVFVGGAVIQWVRDELRFITESRDAEYYAQKVPDTGGVYLVPAFTGLGAPYWDMYARGCLVGLTRGTTREHIIRAAQESIAYQSYDLVAAMEKDTGMCMTELNVDGGASRDQFLMQFQADILNKTVRRPMIRETTALGAAYLAGLATGVWSGLDEIRAQWTLDKLYAPDMAAARRERLLAGWHKAVGRSLAWAEPEA